jgi:hypothetical protein
VHRVLALLLVLPGGLLLLTLRPGVPGPTAAETRGVVLDEQGRPLAGACVRFQAAALSAVTDGRGRFRLPGAAEGRRVTASHEGYLIAGLPGADGLRFRLRPLPAEDHEDYAWVEPAPDPARRFACANCHAAIHDEWAASGHARAATGKHFRNLYTGDDWHGRPGVGWGLLTQYEAGSGVCASCHVPSLSAGDPARFDLRELSDPVASRGVHCDYCHKIAGVGDGTLGLSHGNFNLRLLRPDPAEPERQLFLGPLDDVDRGEDSFSPLYRRSRYCASCHEGVVFGVPVYTTWSEWQDSPAGRRGVQCQQCHMTPTGRMTNIAPGHGGLERDPRTLANHSFFRGSREEMLRGCLRVELRSEPWENGVRIVAEVAVEGAGHRVPTGYIDRHLLLTVEGTDRADRALEPARGPRLPGPAGSLAGRPGRLFAKVLTDPEGHAPAPFWKARSGVQDTRLTPGQTERLEFDYPPDLARVRVRIAYRRFWEEVARSKDWPDRATEVFDRAWDVAGVTSPGRSPAPRPGR